MYGIIYCAYNKINGKRYIGQTIQRLCERKAGHYKATDNSYFHKALHKYKLEDWEWIILDHAKDKDELNAKEQWWISQYRTTEQDKGYNLLAGGQGGGEQTKDMIQYARQRFVELYGRERKAAKPVKNIKCVETGIVYKNAAEASRQTKLHHSHIVAVANGHQKTCGGYHWEWCVDISLFPNAIYCKELDKIYLSLVQAQREDHFSNVYLGRAFKKQGSPCIYAGYTFYKLNAS